MESTLNTAPQSHGEHVIERTQEDTGEVSKSPSIDISRISKTVEGTTSISHEEILETQDWIQDKGTMSIFEDQDPIQELFECSEDWNYYFGNELA